MPGTEKKKAQDRERMQRLRKAQQMDIAALKSMIQTLLDNDPNEVIDDVGHTVLDMWRHLARTMLESK